MYSKDDCIEALKEASQKLGPRFTMREYQEAKISPSADTIIQRFGSWNDAKEAVELDKNEINSQVSEKPEGVNLPNEKNWKELTPYQRYYYKNRNSEIKRSKERRRKIKEWFKSYKKELSCSKCNESHPACLDFHHIEDKEIGVTELVSQQNTSKERIKSEIEKCEVLCANCHRKLHWEN